MDYALQLGKLVDLEALKEQEEALQENSWGAQNLSIVANLDCFTEFVESAQTLDVDDDLK